MLLVPCTVKTFLMKYLPSQGTSPDSLKLQSNLQSQYAVFFHCKTHNYEYVETFAITTLLKAIEVPVSMQHEVTRMSIT